MQNRIDSQKPGQLLMYTGTDKILRNSGRSNIIGTYKLEHVPVKDVIVGEALSVEKVTEQLAEVGVIWLVVETKRAAII